MAYTIRLEFILDTGATFATGYENDIRTHYRDRPPVHQLSIRTLTASGAIIVKRGWFLMISIPGIAEPRRYPYFVTDGAVPVEPSLVIRLSEQLPIHEAYVVFEPQRPKMAMSNLVSQARRWLRSGRGHNF